MKVWEDLSEKQKKYLTDMFKKMHLTVEELAVFVRNNKDTTSAEFWRKFGQLERKAYSSIYDYIQLKNSMKRVKDERTKTLKEVRLYTHFFAKLIDEEVLSDWLIENEEELRWVSEIKEVR